MVVEWSGGLPFTGVCATCKAKVERGQRFHGCGVRNLAQDDGYSWRRLQGMKLIDIPQGRKAGK